MAAMTDGSTGPRIPRASASKPSSKSTCDHEVVDPDASIGDVRPTPVSIGSPPAPSGIEVATMALSEHGGLAEEMIQTRTTLNQLENILMTEFGEISNLHNSERERRTTFSEIQRQWRLNSSMSDAGLRGTTNFVARLVEHRCFAVLFMILTLYSLFVPDLEVIWGDKDSKVTVSIVTTVVFALFFIEFVLQIWGRPEYRFRAYFWLDLIALLSLVPDTYFFQVVFAGESLLSGRSYWLLRLLRLSRSSKATRLNRLTRIVRVVALMPRLLFVKRSKVALEAERLLEKKLFRVFTVLDVDMDGQIPEGEMWKCIAKLRAGLNPPTRSQRSKAAVSRSSSRSNAEDREDETPQAGQRTFDRQVSVASDRTIRNSEWKRMCSPGGESRGSDNTVTFDIFLSNVRQDEEVWSRLTAACRHQMRKGNNMQNLTSRHSEDVGVKVALGVLLMLLVLTLVEPGLQDYSALLGLEHIDTEVRQRYLNVTGEVPAEVQDHVNFWMTGIGRPEFERTVVYLDLNKQVYCDEFVPSGLQCGALPAGQSRLWTQKRISLKEIDRELLQSDYRWTDLLPLRLPDLTAVDVSEEELERLTTTVAVLDAGASVRSEATMSVITTVVVIFIIILGIVLLTKDLTYLSRSLLLPLRSLAEEMQSIVQLQLAGLTTDHPNTEKGTAEIRQIQRIFDNMKKAIKSWGKYVPWPVVQLLLHAGVDAKPGVEEREVTLFFSDIASFTSIVESIPPEESLLLLSRYFNDMSKVIDDHGGIVIEFIGDAILSVYGAPLKNGEHATAAVRSTLKMLASLSRINEWSASHGLPEVHIRCGVHTGRVLVGNMGFHSRMKYGVVGENANIPGRLEELNKTYSTEMLISQATFSRLDPEAFVVRPIDYVYLRHATSCESEPIYQVMSRDRKGGKVHRLRPTATLHAEAIALYRARDFARAAELFKQVNETMQEITGAETDFPSVLMMKRSRAYMARPPPPEWDGVWDQASEPS